MSGKQVMASSRTAKRTGRTSPRQPDAAWVALFLLVTAIYVSFYLYIHSRGNLLYQYLLLPDALVARWLGSPPSCDLLDRGPVLLPALGIVGFGWLAGRLLWAAIGVEAAVAATSAQAKVLRLTCWEKFVFSCGLGLNAVSLYVLAAGLAGELNRRALVLPAAAVVALAAWQARRRRNVDREAEPPSEEISPGWLWMAAPFAAAILLGGMLPPLDFDVREYHLQAPKEFFQQGSIGFLPHNVYGNMPLGSEMFSLLGMVLLDDWWLGALVGKTVIACFAPLTALALFAAGRRFACQGAGVVAAVLYLSIPWVSVVSMSGLIEGVLAFYLFLSLYAVLLWRQVQGAEKSDAAGWWRASDGCLALAGLCSGGAVSCKYPAVLFVALPLLAFIAATSAKRRGARGSARAAAVYAMALFAGCGLWFAKTWVLAGNPVYPLLYDWFGGATRTPEINARWLAAHRPNRFDFSALSESLATVGLTSAGLSPIVAPLAVVGLFVRRYRRLAWTLAGYFGYVIAAWWLFTHRIDRFWIPALPVLSLLAGMGAVWSTSLAWRRAALATIAAGLGASFVYATSQGYNPYFVSLAQARHDPDRVNGWHEFLNLNVPPGSSVLSVGDAQVFDIEVPVIYNTVFDPSIVASICEDRTPEEIAAELRRRRISHVFVDWREIGRYRQPGNYGGIPDFVTREFFQRLVEKHVLHPPWQMPSLSGQEVYRVR